MTATQADCSTTADPWSAGNVILERDPCKRGPFFIVPIQTTPSQEIP